MQVDMDATNGGDVWDDSALLDSWNTALEEYKKYHSIHARGGAHEQDSVQTLFPPASHVETKDRSSTEISADEKSVAAAVDASLNDPKAQAQAQAASTTPPGIATTAPADAASGGDGNRAEQVAAAAALGPQVILGSGQDEGLKALLMAWYYAGYYTGLHQGTQQGKQEAQQEKRGP